MPKNILFIKFFSSGMQAFALQLLSGVFFYIISIYLSKDNFGMISWMNAMSLFLTTVLGLGLEQVVIRRISASDRSDWAAAAFLWHSIIGAMLMLGTLFIINATIGNTADVLKYLPWFFAAQGIVAIVTPLKQFLNAKERFTPYGIIAMISNSCKIVAAFWLRHIHLLNATSITIVLIGTACFELCCLLIYIITQTNFSFKFHFKAYLKLVKESAAQYISVIFDMSLSRMDWILLGMLATNAMLADYSFAYRAAELAKLPMYIIGPIILPRFSRLMSSGNTIATHQQQQINSFNRVEVFFSVLIPLILNILWAPVVSLITGGKYGEANALQFLVLSLCIPLQFFINLLWSLSFAAKKYKQVTTIIVASAVTNILLNFILIGRFGGLGASVAFLATIILQCFLYYRLVRNQIMFISLQPLVLFAAIGGIIYFVSEYLNLHYLVRLVLVFITYMIAGILSKQITKQHIQQFKQFLT